MFAQQLLLSEDCFGLQRALVCNAQELLGGGVRKILEGFSLVQSLRAVIAILKPIWPKGV